jgi:hypothetical protein
MNGHSRGHRQANAKWQALEEHVKSEGCGWTLINADLKKIDLDLILSTFVCVHRRGQAFGNPFLVQKC